MSITTLMIGQSGTGKSASMRNLDPSKVLLIQAINKPLPFRPKGWNKWDGATKTGSIYASRDAQVICKIIAKAHEYGKEIIIIDDFQYVMAGEFMDKSAEKGFDKFSVLAKNAWDIVNAAINAPDNTRVYILSHSQTDEYGTNVKMKTIGKMLDEKVTLEGLFTTVLRSHVSDGRYYLTTQNDGTDTVKSPMGLFETMEIDNDLQMIDEKLKEYFEIGGS